MSDVAAMALKWLKQFLNNNKEITKSRSLFFLEVKATYRQGVFFLQMEEHCPNFLN